MFGLCVHVVVMLAMGIEVVIQAQAQPRAGNFHDDFQVTWSADKVRVMDGGQRLQLSLDRSSGSGFKSKKDYLFSNIDMQIKLVPGDSAGTVTAYYLSSQTTFHDELDFEFLGNETGQPYIVQTNVFANGVGGREQRIYLWFDPTADFHTYTIFWTPKLIVFLVDGTPIRVFKKTPGQPYLDKQPMAVYSSIWNGDEWATRGGLVKTNWAHAPFVTSYRNFQVKPAPIPPRIDYSKLSWAKGIALSPSQARLPPGPRCTIARCLWLPSPCSHLPFLRNAPLQASNHRETQKKK
ncbi:hypothetical protein GOP47_0015800 [Adiantum capillus-veneris]|uniref:GH16 domain-containing protein n=1 Tax=Adiantum capillus-veneris TaxID=13818 RepID=A0A9D4UKC9_ADICA|nr:hypothetical protein GOP47_0015800 [Adiantum capillus-veneris]